MQTKHSCVWIQLLIKYRKIRLSPPVFSYRPFEGGASCVDLIRFCVCLCRTAMSSSCSLIVKCLERADLFVLFYLMFSCVVSLSHTVFWVLDCIDS